MDNVSAMNSENLAIGDLVWIPKYNSEGRIVDVETDETNRGKIYIVQRHFLSVNKNHCRECIETKERFIPFEVEPYDFRLVQKKFLEEPEEALHAAFDTEQEPAPETVTETVVSAPTNTEIPETKNSLEPKYLDKEEPKYIEPEATPIRTKNSDKDEHRPADYFNTARDEVVNIRMPIPSPLLIPHKDKHMPKRVGYDGFIEDGAVLEATFGTSRIEIKPKGLGKTAYHRPVENSKPSLKVGQTVRNSRNELFRIVSISFVEGKVVYKCAHVNS